MGSPLEGRPSAPQSEGQSEKASQNARGQETHPAPHSSGTPTLAENLEPAQVSPHKAFLPSQWSAEAPHSLVPATLGPGVGPGL